jgi:hypothetical protein
MHNHKRLPCLVACSGSACFSLGGAIGAPSIATDRRALAVLQGTDWIKPDAQVGNGFGNVTPYGGSDEPFPATFLFLADPQPLPGDPGTVGFPAKR